MRLVLAALRDTLPTWHTERALLGVGWALCIGLIGGLLPALQASRVPVSVALRAT